MEYVLYPTWQIVSLRLTGSHITAEWRFLVRTIILIRITLFRIIDGIGCCRISWYSYWSRGGGWGICGLIYQRYRRWRWRSLCRRISWRASCSSTIWRCQTWGPLSEWSDWLLRWGISCLRTRTGCLQSIDRLHVILVIHRTGKIPSLWYSNLRTRRHTDFCNRRSLSHMLNK